jgi:hypothetical protein
MTGTLWTTRMITVLWKQFFAMWELWNQKVHGHDNKTSKLARHRHLANEVKFLHTQRTNVLMTDQDIFIGSNEDDVTNFLDNTTPKHIENWLQIWRPVIIDSAKAAAAYAITAVQPMTTYFESLRQTPNPKRPPKPRYSTTAHTRNDGTDQVQRRSRATAHNSHITSFFSCRSKIIESQQPSAV